MRVWTTIAAVLGALSCGPTTLPTATAHQAVLAAQSDTTSTEVFLLDLRFDTGAGALCSAVLVTPRVLLTAAHCVEPALHNATSVTVRATNKATDVGLMTSDFIDVTAIARHPQWSANDTQSVYDLAALQLATAPSATPATIARTLPAGLATGTLRVVGYGRTTASTDDSGSRRTANVAVTSVSADVIEFGAAGTSGICAGDSGGPSYFATSAGARLVGIHSLTRSSDCGSGDDIRVDARLDFIDGFIAAHDPPSCAADGRCAPGCTPADPDCATTPDPCAADGVCTASCPSDPDCAPDGTVCTDATTCQGQRCVADPRGFSFCSRACTATTDCQLSMVCRDHLCQADQAPLPPAQGGCATVPAPGLFLFIFLFRRR